MIPTRRKTDSDLVSFLLKTNLLPGHRYQLLKIRFMEQNRKVIHFSRRFKTFMSRSYNPSCREFRTVYSIKSRSNANHKESMAFSICHPRIVRSQLTDVSLTDTINMATSLYNCPQIYSIARDCSKYFKLLLTATIIPGHQKLSPGWSIVSEIETTRNKAKLHIFSENGVFVDVKSLSLWVTTPQLNRWVHGARG